MTDGNVAQLIVGIVTFVGVVAAFLTYRAYVRGMQTESILHIVNRLEENRQDRHVVYDISTPDAKTWDDNQRRAADEVCRGFDLLGYFYKQRIVPDSFLKDLYAIPVVRCWKKCEIFVNGERMERGQESHFNLFEDLAKHCETLRPDVLKETSRS